MGRSRTPTHILEMRGAFKKNPARGRARAMTAEAVYQAPVRGPFPAMPSEFRGSGKDDTPKRRRLRDIWEEIEFQTRHVNIGAENMEKLPFVCELLWKCRYGRSASDEDRGLAGRWLSALRMNQSYANRGGV